jgi:hypothetical protein
VAREATAALDELREITHGIHSSVLTTGGLRPALRTLARRAPLPVELHVHVDARLPEPVETGAYYTVAEALTNTAKYAHASTVTITVDTTTDTTTDTDTTVLRLTQPTRRRHHPARADPAHHGPLHRVDFSTPARRQGRSSCSAKLTPTDHRGIVATTSPT